MNFLTTLHAGAAAHLHSTADLPFDPLLIACALVLIGVSIAAGVVVSEQRS